MRVNDVLKSHGVKLTRGADSFKLSKVKSFTLPASRYIIQAGINKIFAFYTLNAPSTTYVTDFRGDLITTFHSTDFVIDSSVKRIRIIESYTDIFDESLYITYVFSNNKYIMKIDKTGAVIWNTTLPQNESATDYFTQLSADKNYIYLGIDRTFCIISRETGLLNSYTSTDIKFSVPGFVTERTFVFKIGDYLFYIKKMSIKKFFINTTSNQLDEIIEVTQAGNLGATVYDNNIYIHRSYGSTSHIRVHSDSTLALLDEIEIVSSGEGYSGNNDMKVIKDKIYLTISSGTVILDKNFTMTSLTPHGNYSAILTTSNKYAISKAKDIEGVNTSFLYKIN